MRCQKHDERSYGRMLIATAQPPFTSPRIRSAGTTTSSKNTSANSLHAVDHLDRRDGDPRRVHVDEERGDAAVARLGRPGARQQHAPIGVLRQARPDLLAVDHPRRRGRRRRRREPRGSSATRGRSRCPAPRTPGTTSPRPTAGAGTTSAASSGGAKSMSVGASTSMSEKRPGIGEVARRERRAELGAEHRRAAEPADPLGPAVPHPARVEQDRLHALHLRDLLVERSGRRDSGGASSSLVRVEPRVELGAEVGDRRPAPRLVHSSPFGRESRMLLARERFSLSVTVL